MKKIKIITEDMRFVHVPMQQLDETYVFQLVKTGRMSLQDFAHWLEAVKDEWFLRGIDLGKGEVK